MDPDKELPNDPGIVAPVMLMGLHGMAADGDQIRHQFAARPRSAR